MSFRFLHAADLHLDTPFESIGEVAPRVATALRDASLDALDGLVDCAIAERVAFVVLAGDVYDGAERGIRAQLRLLAAVERLDAAGIHTFIAHGNHDPVAEGWSAIRRWPERAHVFGSETVEATTLELPSGDRVTVHGISYARRETCENLAARFSPPGERGLHVAVLHANVGGQADHGPYSPCTLADLVGRGFDYWALGHIHKRQILHAARPLVAYPGNLQGRSPKASERGAKGALLVEAGSGGIGTPRFVALDRVRFAEVDLDVSTLADLGAVRAELAAAAERARAEHGQRPLILRGRLIGRGGPIEAIRHPEGLDALLAELREEAPGGGAFVWWSEVRDALAAAVDLDALATEDGLAGELARDAARLVAAQDAVRRLVERRGSALVRDFLRTQPDEELLDLVRAAAEEALALAGEEA